MAGFTFESRLPGSWTNDRAHMVWPASPMFEALFPKPFADGFRESFVPYGMPLDGIRMQVVNAIPYTSGVPIGDGLDDPAGEFERRAAAADETWRTKPWRAQLAEWDHTVKPASLRAHRALGSVALQSLSDDGLASHLESCIGHHCDMVRQHHRHNSAAILPVGDFLAHAMRWTGRPASSIIPVFEGHSPLSGVWSEEIADAAMAIATDEDASGLLASASDAAKALATLSDRLPAVEDYVDQVHFRIVDGFDIVFPTLGELPELILGKLRAAVAQGGPRSTDTADRVAAEIRQAVPEEHRNEFDQLLAEARMVYRLRDERGVLSDMSSAGLLRLALLELGRRMEADGRAEQATHALFLTSDEAVLTAARKHAVAPAELKRRERLREEVAKADVPVTIGDPPQPPPDPALLPPAMARVVTAFGALMAEPELDEPDGPDDGASPPAVRGRCGHPGRHEGRARLVLHAADLLTVEPGDVIVAKTTSEAFNAAIFLAGAIVTDHGGIASHAAIVAREVGIPAVVGTERATVVIADGDRVVVDADSGTVTVVP